ncbi:iron-containing redox enzyme family protein [Pseudomonas sp. 15FMM2]|uniref:Iron-containing redox enzyme family protein n=1 Tax=Pseudomonas imrae TaxID=2992837 RepID=A0ACC7P8K1_9PSED
MSTCNFSSQQLQNLNTPNARVVARALVPHAPYADIEAASKVLRELTESAHQGDDAAYAEYQKLLYILSLSDDVHTSLTRRWLSDAIYRVEERFISSADLSRPLSEEGFQEHLEREISSQSREKHPMSQFVFAGLASPAQLQVFLRHQWFRTFRLYREAADLLVNLMDVDEAAALARYLYGELGEEDEQRSHPRLLAKLLNAMDLQADFQAISTMPEEIAYLNNRARCFRDPDVSLGLAVFYITELVVPGNHEKLYRALLQAGLSEDAAEYYKIHISLVPPRAKREWQLIARRIPDLKFQNAFLTSLSQHFRLERAYYDAVWVEMQKVK